VIAEAALVLRRGGLVAFPTETVYGLGVNALDGTAAARLFAVKGRPADNPLIIHVAGRDMVFQLAGQVPEKAILLMDIFWPGPLTLVLPGGKGVPAWVTGGLDTVAIRMPDHPVALALIREAALPVAAPSANISGRPSPTTAGHVLCDLAGRIEVVLDGGPTGLGVESTVLDLTAPTPQILRPGGITPEDLQNVLGAVEVHPGIRAGSEWCGETRSPGLKYTHYAPDAPLLLVEGSPESVTAKIVDLARQYRAKGLRAGILSCTGRKEFYGEGEVLQAGGRDDPAAVAAGLYAALRRFDELAVDIILAEGIKDEGIGLAIMNRLRKAAGHRLLRV
jgi:L-threonylcarbamoyladenylate synthase